MGTWGTHPLENDAALDFLTSLINETPVKRLVNKKNLDDYDYNELRAVAFILIHLHKLKRHPWFESTTVERMVYHFEKMVKEGSCFDSWYNFEDAKKVKREVDKYIKDLNNLLKEDLVY